MIERIYYCFCLAADDWMALLLFMFMLIGWNYYCLCLAADDWMDLLLFCLAADDWTDL